MGLVLVKSEFTIKNKRIVTLAYDPQACAFIIIEYKRDKNISVVDQSKGTVENRIGQVRRFITIKTDLNAVTEQEVKQVEQFLNDRPLRKFNYKTHNQVLQEKIALIT
jgi:hypothetical protein